MVIARVDFRIVLKSMDKAAACLWIVSLCILYPDNLKLRYVRVLLSYDRYVKSSGCRELIAQKHWVSAHVLGVLAHGKLLSP